MNHHRDRYPSFLVRLAILGSSLLAISACDVNAQDPHPGTTTTYHDYTGYVEEYQEATQRLQLPTKANWPAIPSPPAESRRYAKGVGTTDAELFWYCQWEKEWLASYRMDTPHAAAALTQIKQIKSFQVYTVALDDASRQQIGDSITKAESGDPTGVQADVRANCR